MGKSRSQVSVRGSYDALVRTTNSGDYIGNDVTNALFETVRVSLASLRGFDSMPLVCDTGKQYFSFVSDGVKSRPVNARLYDRDIDESSIARVLACDLSGLDEQSLGRILYTIAISYCAAADMVSRGGLCTNKAVCTFNPMAAQIFPDALFPGFSPVVIFA